MYEYWSIKLSIHKRRVEALLKATEWSLTRWSCPKIFNQVANVAVMEMVMNISHWGGQDDFGVSKHKEIISDFKDRNFLITGEYVLSFRWDCKCSPQVKAHHCHSCSHHHINHCLHQCHHHNHHHVDDDAPSDGNHYDGGDDDGVYKNDKTGVGRLQQHPHHIVLVESNHSFDLTQQ